jgi:cytochrome c-type biogenesis protein CcmH/NrfF
MYIYWFSWTLILLLGGMVIWAMINRKDRENDE